MLCSTKTPVVPSPLFHPRVPNVVKMAVFRLHHHSSVSGKFRPIFRISRYACSINRCCATSTSSSAADNKNEEVPIESPQQVSVKAPKDEREIPPPKKLSLYEYVKILEGSLARGKGTILKGWSSLTARHLKHKKLNITAALQPESPRIIGLTAQLVEERLNFLAQIGIKRRDAVVIALEFPAILSWDSPSFAAMLRLLKDLNCDIIRLMCKSPYVFGLEHSRATENIHRLETVGLSKYTIGKLVSVNPLILTFPLRDDALQVIGVLLDAHNSIQSNGVDNGNMKADEAVLNLLLQSLEKLKEQVNLNDNFRRLVIFLQEMQVSPLVIGVKSPAIFNTDIERLISAVEFFRSKPLLLEMDVIQHLLISRTEIFVNFNFEAMTNRVQLIYDVVQSPTVLHNLVQKTFLFDNNNATIKDLILWFQSKGVDDKEIANLVNSRNFFSLKKRELTERLKYLLSIEGVKMEDITKNPSCLLKPLSHLKARVGFLKENKPDGFNEGDLCRMMTHRDEYFATEICGSTLSNFTQFLQSNQA